MDLQLFTSLTAMSFLWIGSQIPLFLFGSVLVDIYGDIGGAGGRWVWMIIGYLIPNAALCPFVGALSDLFGRRYVAAVGQVALIVGPIVVATATQINYAIAGQVISGFGAGLNELIALAGTSELVPIRKRSAYVGAVVFTILPFCPSPMWAQLIARASNWRYVGILVGVWNFIGLIMVAFLYKDPAAMYKQKRPAKDILREIDYVGGVLSIIGVMCFMMGMQWGAQQYTWTSVHVLVPFFIGVFFIVAFFVWEVKFAKFPMCPKGLFRKDKRSMIVIFFITFFSGANFFVLLLFWPTQVYNMYGNDPIGIGIRTLPIGFGIIGGAVIGLVLIGVTKGRTKALLIFWTAAMTAFTGAMSVARTDNLTPTVYPIVTLASIAVGAVIIPCSIIAQVICPTEFIGTVTAITLSIRYIGGAIGFTAYYNVFYANLKHVIEEKATGAFAAGLQVNIISVEQLTEETTRYFTMAAQGQFKALEEAIMNEDFILPSGKATAYDIIITITQEAFALAYRWPYWISIAFGGACFILSFFMRDIRQHLQNM
jgi:MFS family permease